MTLTVACLFVAGEYPYTVDYVIRLKDMVERRISRAHRFVCLTDRPWLLPATVETIPVAKFPDCFAYWTKLELFNRTRDWRGRMLYLDLDTLIVAPLDPIVDYPADFALTADPPLPGHKGRSRDAYGRQIVRRFNSSVMVWDGGTQTHLFDSWTPSAAETLSGDQDYIAHHAPDAVGLPRKWFPRLSEVDKPPFHPDVKVILSKVPKNDLAEGYYPWFGPLWGHA